MHDNYVEITADEVRAGRHIGAMSRGVDATVADYRGQNQSGMCTLDLETNRLHSPHELWAQAGASDTRRCVWEGAKR